MTLEFLTLKVGKPRTTSVVRWRHHMCNFSDLIEERAIEQGIEQGRRLELDYGIRTAIKAYSMLGSSYEKARAFIMKEYNLSPSDAEAKMQEYWEN